MYSLNRFLLISVFSLVIAAQATGQWVNEGEQISQNPASYSYSNNPFISASLNGCTYITWHVVDTAGINSVRLIALNDSGSALPGWPIGGTVISKLGWAQNPQLVTSQDSGVIVTWEDTLANGNMPLIFTQKYSTAGIALWNNNNPVQVSTSTANENRFPVLISDAKNGAYIAWVRGDSSFAYNTQELFMQHVNNFGLFDVLWNSNGAGIATIDSLPQQNPQLALTPDQSAIYAVFGRGYIGDNTLVLNKFNTSNGVVANGWPLNGVVISSGPNVYTVNSYCNLNVSADSENNAVIFWLEARTPYVINYEVLEQVVNPLGEFQLPAEGIILAGANYFVADDPPFSTGVLFLEVTRDTTDQSLLLAFSVSAPYPESYDIGLIKTDAHGNILWLDTLLTDNGTTAYPAAIPDGKGGAFVFYQNDSAYPYQLQVLALNAQGNIDTGWVVNGPSFGSISTYDFFEANEAFSVAYTRRGEAAVTWTRTDEYIFPTNDTVATIDIFACNVLRTGQTCLFNAADTVPAGCKDTAHFTYTDTGSNYNFQDASTGESNVVSYYWQFGDGDISILKNPVHTYSAAGSYLVCLTVQDSINSCSGQICDTVVVTISAINPISGKAEVWSVYPNPCNTGATVYFASAADYGDLVLKIFDLSGDLVQQNKITAFANNNISTRALSQGMYLYQLTGDNITLQNGKLVKQ